MSKESLVFIVGVIVFLLPFLGVPSSWKEYVFIVCGVVLMIAGFLLRRAAFLRSIEKDSGERQAEAFAESVERNTKGDAEEKPSI